MSNDEEILEWFNYEAILTKSEALNLNKSKYQDELNEETKALFNDVIKGNLFVIFKLGESLSYRADDASLWFKSEKHREYKYNSWILMGLGLKQLYPSYQKEALVIHYPAKIADLISIDGINNIDILNKVRREAKIFLFKK